MKFGEIVIGALAILWVPQAINADIAFGYSYGYSYALKEKQFNVVNLWGGAKSFTIPELRACHSFYAHSYFKNSHFGLGFEILKQNYNKVHKITSPGAEYIEYQYPNSFIYGIISLNYRLFRDRNKRLNPYMSAGLMSLFYLDIFGSGPPAYPYIR